MVMSQGDRRRYVRLQHHFPAKVFKLGFDFPVHGVTVNLSPGGALIKTTDYRAFQAEDQTTITLFLPSACSGKDQATVLQGTATVTRIDHQNEGIAVEFDKPLKQFDQTDKK
jgi:c-di-GMP-binding flagellar brake protein YcgR